MTLPPLQMSAGSHLLSLDRAANGTLNLASLQRIDPDVRDIVATANHVAVYEFSSADQTWVRGGRAPT